MRQLIGRLAGTLGAVFSSQTISPREYTHRRLLSEGSSLRSATAHRATKKGEPFDIIV